MTFSEETLKYLKNAGWHSHRKAQRSELKLPYDDYPKKAISFLTEFSGLEGACKAHTYTPIVNEFWISADTDKELLSEDGEFFYYQKLLNNKLYPIGGYLPYGYYLCCDADCRMYMIGERCVYLGNTLFEGFDSIILQQKEQYLLDEDSGRWWNDEGNYVELPPLEK